MRGDVPQISSHKTGQLMFSPRARGCSCRSVDPAAVISVFPACAGMFPNEFIVQAQVHSFPRVRGDVPSRRQVWSHQCRFSPRARGCSQLCHMMLCHMRVFPACAGMFPGSEFLIQVELGFPRVRGDVPASRIRLSMVAGFSPRARGCSV